MPGMELCSLSGLCRHPGRTEGRASKHPDKPCHLKPQLMIVLQVHFSSFPLKALAAYDGPESLFSSFRNGFKVTSCSCSGPLAVASCSPSLTSPLRPRRSPHGLLALLSMWRQDLSCQEQQPVLTWHMSGNLGATQHAQTQSRPCLSDVSLEPRAGA